MMTDNLIQLAIKIATCTLVDARKIAAEYGVKGNIWTFGNPKTSKGESMGYYTGILHLAAGVSSGVANMCKWMTKQCRFLCLGLKAGRAALGPRKLNVCQKARVNRTKLYKYHRAAFMAIAKHGIEAGIRKADRLGLTFVFRPNGTSDEDFTELIKAYPNHQAYDYTKSIDKMRDYLAGRLPKNYHLTFSLSESNHEDARWVLDNGGNVAMVCDLDASLFCGLYPEWRINADGRAYRTIVGDAHDCRFLDDGPNEDGSGNLIVLKLKIANGYIKSDLWDILLGGFIQLQSQPHPDSMVIKYAKHATPDQLHVLSTRREWLAMAAAQVEEKVAC